MAFSSDLERLLARWLPRQRWFPELGGRAGQEPDLTPVSVTRLADAQDPEAGLVRVLMAVVEVSGASRSARIALPLTFRPQQAAELRDHRVGEAEDLLLGPVHVYDGAADPVCVRVLLSLVQDAAAVTEAHVSGHHASEQFEAAPAQPPYAPDEARLAESAAALRVTAASSHGRESRTLVDTDDGTFVLTLIRTLEEERPPAVKLPLGLTAAGSSTIHPVVGWVQTTWFDSAAAGTLTAPFALVAHALPGSHPAWRDAVRLALRADSGSVGSFNRQASGLGAVVGELHTDLAAEFGQVQSTGEPARSQVGRWRRRVGWALGAVPEALAGLEARLHAHSEALEALESLGPLQRVHGGLTLDTLLTGTAEGPRVISFSTDAEDEPRLPELDLVSLMRSIDYAAGFAWIRRMEESGEKDEVLRSVASLGLFSGDAEVEELRDSLLGSPERRWCGQALNSLLSGYSHATGATAALRDPVLRAALIDRLLLEIVTERRTRPTWVIVPLVALTALVGAPQEIPADQGTPEGAADAAQEPAAGAVPEAAEPPDTQAQDRDVQAAEVPDAGVPDAGVPDAEAEAEAEDPGSEAEAGEWGTSSEAQAEADDWQALEVPAAVDEPAGLGASAAEVAAAQVLTVADDAEFEGEEFDGEDAVSDVETSVREAEVDTVEDEGSSEESGDDASRFEGDGVEEAAEPSVDVDLPLADDTVAEPVQEDEPSTPVLAPATRAPLTLPALSAMPAAGTPPALRAPSVLSVPPRPAGPPPETEEGARAQAPENDEPEAEPSESTPVSDVQEREDAEPHEGTADGVEDSDEEDEDLGDEDLGDTPQPKRVNARRWGPDDFSF